MNKFAYQVYYEQSGPTRDSLSRTPKSADEIDGALSTFPNDLRHFLADTDAKVSHDEKKRTENSIFVVIETTDAAQQVADAVERCLDLFGLFGKKLEQV